MPNAWENLFQQHPIRETTSRLVDCLLLDVWPSVPVVADFGISSSAHFAALKHAIFFDDDVIGHASDEDEFERQVLDEVRRRVIELDAALQHGQRLTAFVRKYAPEPYAHVEFHTGMDDLAEALEQSRNDLGR